MFYMSVLCVMFGDNICNVSSLVSSNMNGLTMCRITLLDPIYLINPSYLTFISFESSFLRILQNSFILLGECIRGG